MKYKFCLFYLILLIFAMTSLLRGQVLSGAGTKIDPYQIYDGADLRLMENYITNSTNTDSYFALQNDIDLSAYSNWKPLTENGVPNTSSYYHLDGQSYTISGMTIDTTITSGADVYLGLFYGNGGSTGTAPIDPQIKDLIMSDCHIDVDGVFNGTNLHIGILVGSGNGGGNIDTSKVTRIYVDSTCTITTSSGYYRQYIGGVIGYGEGDKIYSEVQMDINVTAGTYTYVGGVIGNRNAGDVTNQLGWNGKIVRTGVSAGLFHIIGGISASGGYDQYNDCFSIGKFGDMTSTYEGAIFGRVWNMPLYNSYADLDSLGVNGTSNSGYVAGNFDNMNVNPGISNVFYTKRNKGVVSTANYFTVQSASNWDTVGTRQPIDSIKSQNFLETTHGWDFTDVWIIGIRFNGRPYLQWMDELIPNEQQTIQITAPIDNDIYFTGDSVTVEWLQDYSDTVTIRRGYYAASTYFWLDIDTVFNALQTITHFPNPSEVWRIRITAVKDGTETLIYDEIRAIILDSDALTIESVSPLEASVTLTVAKGDVLDSLNFYVGADTNSMFYLGKSAVGNPLDTYMFAYPDNFYASGTYYYKVTNDVDTSSYINLEEPIKLLGIPKSQSTSICYYNKGTFNIGINRMHDAGCGWVSNMTYYYHNFLFQTEKNLASGEDSLSWGYKTRVCDRECRIDPACKLANCTNAYNNWYTNIYDTLTSINDSTQTRYINELSLPSPFTMGSRTFYKHSVWIMCNDLQTGEDSIIVRQLPNDDAQSILRLVKYNIPNDNDTLFTDGTSAGKIRALTELDEPKFVIYRDTYDGWSYFDAPKTKGILKQDIYETIGNIVYTKNSFRGIHPKIIK